MHTSNFLSSSIKQFQYYKSLGDKTFNQLKDEDLFFTSNSSSNSIAIIVNHLHGNMMSRWTNFLTEDGEKSWRTRDEEFENVIKTRNELLRKWEEGWSTLFNALDTINESNIDQEVYIRNMGHTIIEAIQRQLCHYAYHVGQIIYISKMIIDCKWKSLSIPKGGSKEYNASKFNTSKHKEHFTEEFLNEYHIPYEDD